MKWGSPGAMQRMKPGRTSLCQYNLPEAKTGGQFNGPDTPQAHAGFYVMGHLGKPRNIPCKKHDPIPNLLLGKLRLS